MLLKPYNHRRSAHQNILPFRNLILSATYFMSSLISFPNFDDTTVDYILVEYEATNITSGTVNSISGNATASKNEKPLAIYPEEEGYTEY